MQINLEIAKKLIGLTKKNNEKVTLLNGKVVDIKGNIVKITANNKLYVVVINNSKILKNSSIVNLIFSNRQVTTPRISQLSERGKYVEAKLLFESEIENFQNDKTTSQGPIICNPSRVISNIFNFMFSERNIVKVLSLLSPNQLETLVEDLREITEALVKTSDPKLEDFKRNLAEFIVRVGKNLPRFLSFPKKIRLAVLRIYLDLDERTESVDKNDKITKKTTGGNTNSEKITPNEKKIFSDETVETKRTKFSNEHIAKKITKNFTERGIMPTQRDERQLDESSGVIRPKKTQKVEDETLDMGKKSRSSKLPTKFTEPHSYKKEMNIKFPKKVKLISLTFPKNHKDSNFTSNPKSIENVINEKNEIKNLIKLLRFSLVSLKTKTSQKIVEHVETVSKERPKDVFHILPKKSDIHISHMNSSLKEAVGNDNHLPSKPQSFFKNSSKNQPHFARETQISMFKAIPSSQKEIFESFKPTLLKYLNEESLDKIFLLFEKLPSEIEMELERNQIPVDVEMKKEILRDSFETLVLEIEKKLTGKKADLEKVKILLRDLAQKVLESRVTKKDELVPKFDEKRMLYSKIIDYMNNFLSMRSIFLNFENIQGRIDLIDKGIDPKIKRGFRLIFDLHLKNLGEIVLDTIMDSKKVDLRLFVEEKTRRIFQENYEAFKRLFEEEGYSLRSFLIMGTTESKTLKNERFFLLSRTGGIHNWIA